MELERDSIPAGFLMHYRLAALCVCLSLSMSGTLSAQTATPVYARQSAAARTPYRPPVRPPFDQPAYGGFGYGGPFGQQPMIAGSWYSRPYPYHFDYYRWRYSAPTSQPTADCPCAVRAEPVPAELP